MLETKKRKSKFELGEVVATAGVADKMAGDKAFALFCGESMARHSRGDWGDLTADDKQANSDALEYDDRLLSAYEHPDGKIWVITEADRSVTTILFPEEY